MKIWSQFIFHKTLNCFTKKVVVIKKHIPVSAKLIKIYIYIFSIVCYLRMSTTFLLCSFLYNFSVFRSQCITLGNFKTVYKIVDIWIPELFFRMFHISNISFYPYTFIGCFFFFLVILICLHSLSFCCLCIPLLDVCSDGGSG